MEGKCKLPEGKKSWSTKTKILKQQKADVTKVNDAHIQVEVLKEQKEFESKKHLEEIRTGAEIQRSGGEG